MLYRRVRRYGVSAVLLALALTSPGCISSKQRPATKTAALSSDARKERPAQTTASALRITRKAWDGDHLEIIDPQHSFWASAPVLNVLLNRTPRIYLSDNNDTSGPPDMKARCAKTSDGTVISLTWDDATKDQPTVRKSSPADASGRVRVAHTQQTNRFYDAAAVMIPVDRRPKANPSIQMGDADGPVEIFLWNAVLGPKVMKAAGRATTERTKKTFPAKAVRLPNGWSVTFFLPELPENASIAFAVWDGSQAQRGGLKHYSLWHTLN